MTSEQIAADIRNLQVNGRQITNLLIAMLRHHPNPSAVLAEFEARSQTAASNSLASPHSDEFVAADVEAAEAWVQALRGLVLKT